MMTDKEAEDYLTRALRKQKPQMVIYESDGFADGNPVYDFAICPCCKYAYEEGDKDWNLPFCPNCGQALKWKDEEGESE